ncbi:MAG TPA: hypothetical protein VGO17_05525 [Aurantimonas sp.]|jgi:hypothetical protein|nr:hypothetical protein [Aurantimonas sp.]
MKTILAAAVATMVVTSAGAGELKPLTGRSFAFGGVTGAAYYTVEADGFRVVATLSASESGSPVTLRDHP